MVGAGREAPSWNSLGSPPQIPVSEGAVHVAEERAESSGHGPPATQFSPMDAGLSLQGHSHHIFSVLLRARINSFISLLFIPS